MEKFSDKARGYAVIKVVGAEPTALINACLANELEIWGPYPEDELTIIFNARLRHAERVVALSDKCCCDVEIMERRGAPNSVKRLKTRYVLWLLPLLLFALHFASTLFIWKIEISGNDKISDIEILNALDCAGVKIGYFSPSLNSSRVDNLVMAEIPELKWISTSVFGSRLRVDVRERTEIPKLRDEDKAVKVVANQAGLIDEMQVFFGYKKFDVGQTVARGDTLIDGLVIGSFNPPTIVHAQGTVIARTWYEISAILPMEYSEKQYAGGGESKFAMKLGNNRINFYSNSGIMQGKCDNIISEYKLGIEGLFALPITIVRERAQYYELVPAFYTEAEAAARLEAHLNEELIRQIGEDGQVVTSGFSFSLVRGNAVGTLRAECKQNIATEKEMTAEEIQAAEVAREEKITND